MSFLLPRPLQFSSKYIVLGVFGIGLMVVVQSSSLGNDSNLEINSWHLVLMFLYYSGWALLVKYINGAVYALPSVRQLSLVVAFKFIVSALLIVSIHFVATNAVYYLIRVLVTYESFSPWQELSKIFSTAMISRMIDFAVISGVLKVLTINKDLQEKNLRLASLESQLHQTQLTSLKAQLNPHFLFNSLHAVSTLIGYDDQKARNMVIKISGLLRKMLEDRDKHTHPLQEELSYIQDYLEIEKERFHDRLEVNFEIDENTLMAEVPSLVLQPLVENAFKHGISQLQGKGLLTLKARILDNKSVLRLTVKNTSPTQNSNGHSTGLGHENLNKRLYQLYGTTATLNIDNVPGNYQIELLIPQNQ